jgi:hypothetical protein
MASDGSPASGVEVVFATTDELPEGVAREILATEGVSLGLTSAGGCVEGAAVMQSRPRDFVFAEHRFERYWLFKVTAPAGSEQDEAIIIVETPAQRAGPLGSFSGSGEGYEAEAAFSPDPYGIPYLCDRTSASN